MKTLLKNSLFCLLAVTLFTSCDKTEDTPEIRLQGTWELTNFVAVNPGSMQEVDFITEIKKLFPCIGENRITFSEGAYVTSFPSSCVSEDGQSLQFFPAAQSGTYTILDNGTFSLNDDRFLYEGTYKFDGNKKFVFVIEDASGIITATFDKK
ncbi:MAG: hypothetical protein ACJAZY_000704 [Spirosomataceae bacterium]